MADADGSSAIAPRKAALQRGFQLAGWTVEPERNRLFRNGTERFIESKVMDLLVALAAADGRTLSKDDLLESVWKGTVVVEGVIYRTVAELRAALDDDARAPTVVENIPKRGYRLLATVAPLAAERIPVAIKSVGRRGQRYWLTVLVGIAAVVTGYGVWTLSRHETAAQPITAAIDPAPANGAENSTAIAVLPFQDFSATASPPWFSEGVSDEIIHSLANVSGLRVMSRTSSFAVARQHATVAEIRRQLNVGAVLEGSVRAEGDRIRVTAQLIDARNQLHLWSKVYDQSHEDVFAIEQDIAQSIAHALLGMLRPTGEPTYVMAKKPYANFDAYRLYLEARFLCYERNAASLRRALALLDQAVDLDPSFAQAFALRANALYVATFYTELTFDAMAPRARADAARALELDPNNAEAYLALGSLENRPAHAAEFIAALRKAVSLAPNDSQARQRLGERLLALGYINEAAREIEAAVRSDPLAGPTRTVQALVKVIHGDIDGARHNTALATQLGSPRAGLIEAMIRLERGDADGALTARMSSSTAMQRYTRHLQPVYAAARPGGDAAKAVAALAAAPATEKSKEGQFYYEYAIIGRIDLALNALAHLDGHQGAWGELWLPELAPLRRDPGFVDAMTKLGVVSYWREHGWPDYCAPQGERLVCR